ncbi:UNVERIFIED_CONTAM: hypothetical protein FKN15_013589 [Acipenser sinensis]
MGAADPREVTAGGQPLAMKVAAGAPLLSLVNQSGLAGVLGLTLFVAAAAGRFSPMLRSAGAAKDHQHPVLVLLVVKGDAAPASLPLAVEEAEAKAAGAPPLLAAKVAGAPPLLAAVGGPACMIPLLVEMGTADLSLLWVVEAGPAGTLPLLVEVGVASSPPTAIEVEPAGILPLWVETWAVDIQPPPFWAVDTPAPHSWAVDVRPPPSASFSSPSSLSWPVEVMGSAAPVAKNYLDAQDTVPTE